MVKPNSSPIQSYSDSHWHAKLKSSYIDLRLLWSQSAPETPETPEPLATLRADRGLARPMRTGRLDVRTSCSMTCPMPRRRRWSGRESSSGPENKNNRKKITWNLELKYVTWNRMESQYAKKVCAHHKKATVPRAQRGLLHVPARSLRASSSNLSQHVPLQTVHIFRWGKVERCWKDL